MSEAIVFGAPIPGSTVVVHTPYDGVKTGIVQYSGDVLITD